MGLVRRFVGRKADVPVLAEHLHLTPELRAELGEQRLHLASDRLLEEVPGRDEVVPAVVRLETLEPLAYLRPEALELGHGAILSAGRERVSRRSRGQRALGREPAGGAGSPGCGSGVEAATRARRSGG